MLIKLELENNSSLNNFGRCLKDVVDDKLIEHIDTFKSTKDCTNVERLMNFSSSAIIDVLERSPPELFTAMKIFLNRRLPDTLRPYIWSYCLQLNTNIVDVVRMANCCCCCSCGLLGVIVECLLLFSPTTRFTTRVSN